MVERARSAALTTKCRARSLRPCSVVFRPKRTGKEGSSSLAGNPASRPIRGSPINMASATIAARFRSAAGVPAVGRAAISNAPRTSPMNRSSPAGSADSSATMVSMTRRTSSRSRSLAAGESAIDAANAAEARSGSTTRCSVPPVNDISVTASASRWASGVRASRPPASDDSGGTSASGTPRPPMRRADRPGSNRPSRMPGRRAAMRLR
ncbi:MAG: hypothetical protein EBZ59_08070 [Planctomycetia bacterium]|nr:hypothetical protein [Planctomycetia bacterium]